MSLKIAFIGAGSVGYRREAFKNAKYLINCVRIGMLTAFETDVEIPC